jgi:hypothetical protein
MDKKLDILRQTPFQVSPKLDTDLFSRISLGRISFARSCEVTTRTSQILPYEKTL